jgi:FecR protein
MARPKIALTMLILGSVMVWGTDARAQVDPPSPGRLAQAPASPPPPATPPAPPAASQPTAQSSQQTPDPVGSVATLQGTASVTRNNATSALALRDPVYKNDVLQTNIDGTLGITFDDETTFTLKPNTRLAVDEFVYQEGGTDNAAIFNVVRGTAAFVAAEVAHTGNMKIDTPTSSLGIRGTTGLVEVPEGGAAGGQVAIKLYPDADGRVGRIEVFGRDGAQLGILSRGATGFAIRPGAGGRFTAAPLQISRQDAERDRTFVRQTFAARTVGRQINQQRPTFQQQRNPLRPNQLNPQRPGQAPGREQRPGLQQQRPELRTVPGGQPLPSTGQRPPAQPGARPTQQQPGAPATPQQPGTRPNLQQQPGAAPPGGRPNAPTLPQPPGPPPTQQQPGARPTLQQQQPGAVPPGSRPNAPTLQQQPGARPTPQQQPGARPTLQRQPGALPGPQRAPAGQRKPAKKNETR